MKTLSQIHRILFVRTDRIGDALMNLPALRLLRQTYPKAWITLFCDTGVAALFKANPDLDEIIAQDMTALRTVPQAGRNLTQTIKQAKFDMIVVSNPDKYFHQTAFMAGIKHRIGYRRKWGFLLNHSLPDDKDRNLRHEIESNLRLAGLVSDEQWDGAMPLVIDPGAQASVENFLSRHRVSGSIVALHVGTTNARKRWPAERFSALADRIQAEGAGQVVLIGGKEERDTGARVCRAAASDLLDATGAFSLEELAAFLSLKNVEALVSADSGPAHIAWILGTPCVVFFAKGVEGCNPVRWGPRDKRSQVIENTMKNITVDEAFLALRRTLSQ